MHGKQGREKLWKSRIEMGTIFLNHLETNRETEKLRSVAFPILRGSTVASASDGKVVGASLIFQNNDMHEIVQPLLSASSRIRSIYSYS